ncbi:hypothetical protein NMY22_g17292 [Coprinellus aureogranulatus]|nr:hypothetical protein NMY22_g17292 [Coprinellus aureogranulatus]
MLFERGLSFHHIDLYGGSHFLREYFSILPASITLHTLRVTNTDDIKANFWPETRATTIPQCPLLACVYLGLRCLDLIGCKIPLTSPILFSPSLTQIIMTVPPDGTVPQLITMLQNSLQLCSLMIMIPHQLRSTEMPSGPPLAILPNMVEVLLQGNLNSLLTVLRQLRMTALKVSIKLRCCLPLTATPLQSAIELLEAVSRVRCTVPTLVNLNEGYSPTTLKIDSTPNGYDGILHDETWDIPFHYDPNPLAHSTYTSIGLFEPITRRPIDQELWLPMVAGPMMHEDLLAGTGWSFSNLHSLAIHSLRDNYSCDALWILVSGLPFLQHITIPARHATKFTPFLFRIHDTVNSSGKHERRVPLLPLCTIALIGPWPTEREFDDLLKLMLLAFNKRKGLAVELGTFIYYRLNHLTFMDCPFPPAMSFIDGISPAYIQEVHWVSNVPAGPISS